ncbi:MAG: type II toxin-antitoxin system RelB/DinJ family antitoxin [Oscillospiraceae bacterium]|nr:type II toxin-antitoxin system RelB/DinJ family antitoxin [Oscillospiraceae bacterium]
MAQTTLNVRIDEDVKKSLEEFCASVGMNTSVAVNMFAKAVIREQRLPFEVIADPFFSKSNKSHLQRSLEQIERGDVVIKTMAELEAMATDE